MSKHVGKITLAVVLAVLLGGAIWWHFASRQPWPTVSDTFGGYRDYSSINGFGILTQVLIERGHRVSRSKILSQAVDSYDLIFWVHLGSRLPDSSALERLEQWMDQGGRVVILYDGYDARLDFWRAVYQASSPEERELARWVLRHEQVESLKTGFDLDLAFLIAMSAQLDSEVANDWTRIQQWNEPVRGLWQAQPGSGYERPEPTQPAPLVIRKSLRPVSSTAQVLAWVQDQDDPIPLLWRDQATRRPGRLARDLWVVSAPLFLNNFGILRPENASLRETFLNEIAGHKRVLFLETGPGPVLQSSSPPHRQDQPWAWMSQSPFPLLILHLILLTVVFCFARFPVFGRAQPVHFRPRNDFGEHLHEVGRLLKVRGQTQFAQEKLAQYEQVVRRFQRGRQPPAAGPPPRPDPNLGPSSDDRPNPSDH